jgi:HK97 gp10 family phage protein
MNNHKNAINVGVTVDRGSIAEKLQSLEPKIVRRSFRKALKAVGTFWVAEMKAKVPVLEGDLQNAIWARVSTRTRSKKGVKSPAGKVEVGPRLDARRTDGKKSVGPGVYGMWVEFGLKKKEYPAKPFARETYDSTADKAVTMFADILGADLESVVRLKSVEKE